MNAFNETKKFVILGILAAISFIGIYIVTKEPVGNWVCKSGRWEAVGGTPKEIKPLGVCR